MSTVCDALTALNLTLGVFCQPTDGAKAVDLPDDDQDVWAIQAPAPAPKLIEPRFPPIIIEAAQPSLPSPPPRPPPPVFKKPEPKPPSAYRLALEVALSQGGQVSADFGSIVNFTVEPQTQIASLTPPVDALDLAPATNNDRYDGEGKTAGQPVDNSRIFAADRYITGIIETGYNSQISGGEIIIQVSRDVYGYHSRNVLIPKGSRMICGDGGPLKQGETRPSFTCNRILMGGYRSEIIKLSAKVSDVQGRLGTADKVDNRFGEKYGTAFILTGISTAVRIATAAAASNDQNSPLGNVADKGSEELSQKLGEISASVIEQTVNLSPIVTISQGKRVVIRPGEDWYISKPQGAKQ